MVVLANLHPRKLIGGVGGSRVLLTLLILVSYFLTVTGLLYYYQTRGYLFGIERERWITETTGKCSPCDISFHITRAREWQFKESVLGYDTFYAPAFHVLLGLHWRLMGWPIEYSFIVVSSVIAVILLPLAIYNLGKVFLPEHRLFLPPLFYLYGTSHVVQFVGWGIVAHALGLFFSLVSLKYMYEYLVTKSNRCFFNAALTTILAVLSHQGTGTYQLIIFLLFLLFAKKHRLLLAAALLFIILALIYPEYSTRPAGYIKSTLRKTSTYAIGHVYRLIFMEWFLWIHPVILVWFFYGLPREINPPKKFLWAAFLLPLLLFWSDENGRSVMQFTPFACIIAARGFRWPKQYRLLFIVVIGLGIISNLGGFLIFQT